jgi:hypothetical protein
MDLSQAIHISLGENQIILVYAPPHQPVIRMGRTINICFRNWLRRPGNPRCIFFSCTRDVDSWDTSHLGQCLHNLFPTSKVGRDPESLTRPPLTVFEDYSSKRSQILKCYEWQVALTERQSKDTCPVRLDFRNKRSAYDNQRKWPGTYELWGKRSNSP